MQRLTVNIKKKLTSLHQIGIIQEKEKKEKEKEDGMGQHFLYNEQRKRKS